ncbi:hypothetical protein KA057_00205 [Candidatus Gracilibacteria bacterium]|nr:hypothetical protein [Candidatus Gracilibacteria bacterium]
MDTSENQILCVEDKHDCGEIVTEQGGKLGVDIAIDLYSAAKALVQEKRKYACIVLDAQFPLASIDVIQKNDKKNIIYQGLRHLYEELNKKSEAEKSTLLGGVILIHFLVQNKIKLTDIIWILNSSYFNGQLLKTLEGAGVKKTQIKEVRDKNDAGGFAAIFKKIKPK